MTNNKVIIDGVDVSKCEYYALYGFCGAEQTTDMKCDDIELHDCYYRQLARKTQECEKLKSALEEIEKFCYRGIGNCDGEAQCNISLIQEIIDKAKEQE